MGQFQWDNKYSVGVAEFDAQHKQLLAIMDELADAIASGKGNVVVAKTINSIIGYTRTHFAAEEKKMQAHQYPGYAAQKIEHDKFIAQAAEFQKKTASGTMPTIQTMQFLRDWLVNHIQKSDKAYMAFFNGRGVT